ncbi:hypothetical protein [Parapedomonas caeni]
MRPLTRTISALLVASIANTAAAPAFADPGHGRGWDRSDRDRHDRDRHDRDRHDRDRHDRYERGRTVYVYRDNDRYRRNYYYGDPYRHHRHKKDNDGEVALGIGLGVLGLAAILATTKSKDRDREVRYVPYDNPDD